MGGNNIYQRRFWVFHEEDTGFASGQEPSGYLKIEVRDNKAKLSVLIQNLKEDEKKLKYKLFLIKNGINETIPVFLGNIRVINNKGEFQAEYDPSNISGSGNSIEDFNMAAVIIEFKDRDNGDIVCPVAAYKDKKNPWREGYKKIMQILEAEKQKEKTQDKIIEEIDLVSKYENKIESKYENKYTINSISDIDKINDSSSSSEANKEQCGAGCINCNIVNTCVEKNKEENENCNLDKLKESLGKYFKEYDPFGSRRRDYKWWKVSSPVYLNNILYQCNVRTPLLFNPKVMMAHFKYRHLIIGLYQDRLRRRDCLVCGVPGAYSIDDNPFGEVSRWVQLEGNKPKYGAFGYWLIYIDPRTGKIINLS